MKFVIIIVICILASFYYARKDPYDYQGEVNSLSLKPSAVIDEVVEEKILNFSFYNQDGTKVFLSDFLGKKIIVNLWASWCAPCLKELPELDNFQSIYQDDVQVITLNIESDYNLGLENFVQMGISNLEFYYDKDDHASKLIEIMGLPTSLILNENLIVTHKVSGYFDWNSDAAKQLLDIE